MADETLQECPLCLGRQFIPHLVCEDHTTSHEKFQLVRCEQCNFVMTNPRPDASSIGQYYRSEEYISHSGRTSGLIGFLYRMARKVTLLWKTSLIQRYTVPVRVLDYGCGTGEVLKACQSHGWQIAGVEPSATARQKARQLTGIPIAESMHELGPGTFDVITLWHVLEHISDLKATLSFLADRLNTKGVLLLAVPNHESPDARFYKQFWAGYDVPRHLWHFSKATMTTLVRSSGMQVHQILPMRLDAYYVSMLSERYRSGRGGLSSLLRGLWRGFASNRRAAWSTNQSSLIYVVRR